MTVENQYLMCVESSLDDNQLRTIIYTSLKKNPGFAGELMGEIGWWKCIEIADMVNANVQSIDTVNNVIGKFVCGWKKNS